MNYYKNELYSDKGQFCHIEKHQRTFISYENNGGMSVEVIENAPGVDTYLTNPWYPITEKEYMKAYFDYVKH